MEKIGVVEFLDWKLAMEAAISASTETMMF